MPPHGARCPVHRDDGSFGIVCAPHEARIASVCVLIALSARSTTLPSIFARRECYCQVRDEKTISRNSELVISSHSHAQISSLGRH